MTNYSTKKAVCLLSGGLDSTTSLFSARHDGYDVTALTIRYGQVHQTELECACAITERLNIPHHVIDVPFPWKGSALLDSAIDIPLNRNERDMQKDIPVTYVPARNTVFLSLAASLAETIGAEAIFIGANAVDYSGYPDCRPEYFEAFARMIEKGTKAGVQGNRIRIEAPLLKLSKRVIVLLGHALDVPFELTYSCYQGREMPCGRCDACRLRAKGFEEAGIEDPVLQYAASTVS